MTAAVFRFSPDRQLAALSEAYRRAVARRRLRVMLGVALFAVALLIAAIGAEVNLRTLFTYFGNFLSYFDRILKTGRRHARLDQCRRMVSGVGANGFVCSARL